MLYIISQSQLHLCCWWCNFSVLTRSFSYFSCSLHCVHRDFQDLWSVTAYLWHKVSLFTFYKLESGVSKLQKLFNDFVKLQNCPVTVDHVDTGRTCHYVRLLPHAVQLTLHLRRHCLTPILWSDLASYSGTFVLLLLCCHVAFTWLFDESASQKLVSSTTPAVFNKIWWKVDTNRHSCSSHEQLFVIAPVDACSLHWRNQACTSASQKLLSVCGGYVFAWLCRWSSFISAIAVSAHSDSLGTSVVMSAGLVKSCRWNSGKW